MAKLSKEEQARREGMSYAHRLVKDGGLDALEKDMKMRGITDCPIGITQKEMDEFAEKVRWSVLDTVLILAACTLQDDFGFGRIRVERFIKGFNGRAAEIADGYAEWGDFQDQLRDDLKIELEIRRNDKDIVI